jgi:predicted phage terminase large subunit-like protein
MTTSDAAKALTIKDLIAAARLDFGIFVTLLFPVLHGGKNMVIASYVDLIVEMLMLTTAGGDQRVIFNLPPGYMKSILVSVLYTAWRMGVNPIEKIICISYGDDLSHNLSLKTRLVMQSAMYRAIFPSTVLVKKAEDKLTTLQGGERYATAVNSDIAGFRADLIVIDDPMQPDAAVNELAKQKLRDWHYGNVAQRLRDQKTGVIVIVMHRLAPDDFTQTLLDEGGWRHFPFPLIATKREFWGCNGKAVHSRHVGDLLSPAWQSAEVVENLKKTTPGHLFAAQFQQHPVYGGSGMCSIERFAHYREVPQFIYTIHFWDIAATKDGGNWTVCMKFGGALNAHGVVILYLIAVIRMRVELPDVRTAIREQDQLDKPALIVIDGTGIGLGLVQDLEKTMKNLYPAANSMKGTVPGARKQQNFNKAIVALYDGLVLLPEQMQGLEILLSEFASFPDGKYDDQVDALSNVAAYRDGVLREARQRAERLGRWAPA